MPDRLVRYPYRYFRSRPFVFAYLLITLVFVVGLLNQSAQNRRDRASDRRHAEQLAAISQYDSSERSRINCEALNQTNAGITTFIELLVEQDGKVSPGEARVRDLAQKQFPLRDCPPPAKLPPGVKAR